MTAQTVFDPTAPVPNLAVGTVIEVDGTHIVAELDSDIRDLSRTFGGVVYAIGQFGSIVKVHCGRRIAYAYVCRLRMKAEYERERGMVRQDSPDARVVEADLFGEGEWLKPATGDNVEWRLAFERGVATYPLPMQRLYLTPRTEMQHIFRRQDAPAIVVGEHVGSGGARAYADMDEMLGKHLAVLGSTGAGKSAAVAGLLHAILDREADAGGGWHPRIVVLDPHNEYGTAFKEHKRLSTAEGTLQLPFWMLDFTETVELLIGKTEFVATSQANIIKSALIQARDEGATKLGLDTSKTTVDSPIPYRLATLRAAITADMPQQASKQDSHNSVLRKLEILQGDSCLHFMMQEWEDNKDHFADVVQQFLGPDHKLAIVDLSGIRDEIAAVASAAIARTLFQVKLWQSPEERDRSPVVLVCEEAHRYVPNRGEAQYAAAQDAIRRIAKEGRKYGLGLILVSQRPSEVEATVLSQCNTWLVMRLTNDDDRAHVRSMLPDSLDGLTKILSGLRRREAVFVGQAATLPSRILISRLDDDKLPRAHDVSFDRGWHNSPPTTKDLEAVGNRWRYQERDITPAKAQP